EAVAAGPGAMPATAGLLGAIPALELAGQRFDARWLTLWGACLGAIGLAMALPLRRRLVVDEPLPFPTGRATAEVITATHASGGDVASRARALGLTGLGAAAITWLRDGPRPLIPSMIALPFSVAGQPAAGLTLGI